MTSCVDSAWVLVRIISNQGSTPRAAGAWMLVQEHQAYGSIGGGNLEWQASATARQLLVQWQAAAPNSTLLSHGLPATPLVLRECSYTLGPQLGQCCGGKVTVRFELLTRASYQNLCKQIQEQRIPLALFGLGHIGMALVRLLQNLPFATQCFDSRTEAVAALAAQAETNWETVSGGCDLLSKSTSMKTALQAGSVCADWVKLPEDARHGIAQLPKASAILIMSHSHVEDFALCKAALQRQRAYADVLWIGLIGSVSKWQGFQKRLLKQKFTEQDIACITSPIGVAGITEKEPAVLAVSIAAQLLQLRTLWTEKNAS